MKKYAYILIAAAAVLAAVSCSKEEERISPESEVPGEETVTEQATDLVNPVTITFSANASTKVSISGEGTEGAKTAVWDDGDEIKIVWYAGGAMGSTTATADSYGTASTTFTATVEDAEYYYAVYPSTLEVTLDGEGNFTVDFPNNRTLTSSFADAAWYAAKATKAAKSFAFHPITTIIKFTVNESDVTGVHFRSLGGDFTKLFATYPVTFTDSTSDGIYEEASLGSPEGGENNVELTLSGAGTYYMMLPANGTSSSNATYGNGFIFKLRKADAHIPAAYYSDVITLTPGKFYNIKSAIDGHITYDYYISPDGTGTGLSSESYSNQERIKGFPSDGGHVAFTKSRAASYMRDGITIHLKGGTYTSPVTLINEQVMARTLNIVGEADGNTTTFTTTASSTFGYSNVNVNLSDITFNGCTTNPAATITAGSISFTSCQFTSNTAANGGALSIGNNSSTDENLLASFKNCNFSGNSATQQGGVLLIPNATTGGIITFNNCLFENNTADGDRSDATTYSSGVAYTAGGKAALLFHRCSFVGNTATANGKVIYLNNSAARLGMNNCSINAGSSNTAKQTSAPIEGGAHQLVNGTVITNKGLTVFANSTIWSKDGVGEWGLIGLGSNSNSNGSLVVNSLVRNGASFAKPAFYNHSNYYQNVQYCVYSGNADVTAEKHTFENNWNVGTGSGSTVSGSYSNKTTDGVKLYYYTYSNDLAAEGFTKATKEQISNLIAKTGESADNAKDGFGKLFLDWLNSDDILGLATDIKGTTRPEGGFRPGSCE